MHSFEVNGEVPQFLRFDRCQICFDVLRKTAEQVDSGEDRNVQINNSGTAALPFPLGRPAQLPYAPRARYHVSRFRMLNQISRDSLDTFRAYDFRGLDLELRKL
jgi:hypothetical protein